MRIARIVARIAAATAIGSSSACVPTLDGPDWDHITIDPDAFCASTGCVGLVVEAATAPRMLKGDTVRVYTRSDSGLASAVVWEVQGAGEIVPQSQTAWPVLYGAAGQSILIRGLTPGTAQVKATHPRPRTAQLSMGVADSNVIAGMKLSSYASPKWVGDPELVAKTAVRVGDSVWVDAVLRDAAGQDYAGRPEGWTISDTSIALMRVSTIQPLVGVSTQRRWIRARAPGAVDVTASFLGVQQTIRITVMP